MAELKIFRCKRCGHAWASKMKKPHVCPNIFCHSIRWNEKSTKKGE